MNDEPDDGENQQQVDAAARHVEGSPGQQPAHKTDHEQYQKDEICNQSHMCFLPPTGGCESDLQLHCQDRGWALRYGPIAYAGGSLCRGSSDLFAQCLFGAVPIFFRRSFRTSASLPVQVCQAGDFLLIRERVQRGNSGSRVEGWYGGNRAWFSFHVPFLCHLYRFASNSHRPQLPLLPDSGRSVPAAPATRSSRAGSSAGGTPSPRHRALLWRRMA